MKVIVTADKQCK